MNLASTSMKLCVSLAIKSPGQVSESDLIINVYSEVASVKQLL